MKKQKPKAPRPRAQSPSRDPHTKGWPGADRMQPDPIEAALDTAARLAEPYPEEAEAIENVIRYVRAARHGRPAEVRLPDLLLALSIILAEADQVLTPVERNMLEMLLRPPTHAGMVRVPDGPAHLPLAIRPRRCPPHASCCPPASTFPVPYVRFAA